MSVANRPGLIRLWHILVLFLCLAVLYNVVTPLYETPDEPQHVEYVRYLVEQRSLPRDTEGRTEAHQPPFYYGLVALATAWIDTTGLPSWHPNPYWTWTGTPTAAHIDLHREDEGFPYRGVALTVHVGRLVSTVLGLGTVLCTYWLARLVYKREGIALGAASIAAFTPGFLFSSAGVNNDAGVTLFSSLVLLISVWLLESRASLKVYVLYGCSIAAAIAMKGNGLQLLPVPIAVLVARALLERRGAIPASAYAADSGPNGWLRSLTATALHRLALRGVATYGIFIAFFAGVLVLGPGSPWMERITFGVRDVGGWLSHGWVIDAVLDGRWTRLAGLSTRLFTSYWGVFGWQSIRMHPAAYFVLLVACLGAVVGLAARARQTWRRGTLGGVRAAQLAVLLIAVGSMLWVVTARFFLGTVVWVVTDPFFLGSSWPALDHGRFLFPGISALSVFMAAGLARLRIPRLRLNALVPVACFLPVLGRAGGARLHQAGVSASRHSGALVVGVRRLAGARRSPFRERRCAGGT